LREPHLIICANIKSYCWVKAKSSSGRRERKILSTFFSIAQKIFTSLSKDEKKKLMQLVAFFSEKEQIYRADEGR